MMLIKNGRVIDPRTGRDETADILVENGRIRAMSTPTATAISKPSQALPVQ